MTITQRTFVARSIATADEAGWRFVTPVGPHAEDDPDATPARRLPSLSWRLRH